MWPVVSRTQSKIVEERESLRWNQSLLTRLGVPTMRGSMAYVLGASSIVRQGATKWPKATCWIIPQEKPKKVKNDDSKQVAMACQHCESSWRNTSIQILTTYVNKKMKQTSKQEKNKCGARWCSKAWPSYQLDSEANLNVSVCCLVWSKKFCNAFLQERCPHLSLRQPSINRTCEIRVLAETEGTYKIVPSCWDCKTHITSLDITLYKSRTSYIIWNHPWSYNRCNGEVSHALMFEHLGSQAIVSFLHVWFAFCQEISHICFVYTGIFNFHFLRWLMVKLDLHFHTKCTMLAHRTVSQKRYNPAPWQNRQSREGSRQ